MKFPHKNETVEVSLLFDTDALIFFALPYLKQEEQEHFKGTLSSVNPGYGPRPLWHQQCLLLLVPPARALGISVLCHSVDLSQ